MGHTEVKARAGPFRSRFWIGTLSRNGVVGELVGELVGERIEHERNARQLERGGWSKPPRMLE